MREISTWIERHDISSNHDEMALQPQFTAINPVRPMAGYIGGKRRLAARLVELIGRTEHETEAFVGMGGVFFRRDRRVNPYNLKGLARCPSSPTGAGCFAMRGAST